MGSREAWSTALVSRYPPECTLTAAMKSVGRSRSRPLAQCSLTRLRPSYVYPAALQAQHQQRCAAPPSPQDCLGMLPSKTPSRIRLYVGTCVHRAPKSAATEASGCQSVVRWPWVTSALRQGAAWRATRPGRLPSIIDKIYCQCDYFALRRAEPGRGFGAPKLNPHPFF